MNVTRVLHSTVNVHNHEEASAEFYSKVLGLQESSRPFVPGIPGKWFMAGDTSIHLVDASCEGSGIDPTGPHACFGVEDLEESVKELDDIGIPWVRGSQNTPQGEVVQIWIVDPAGNTIELQQDVEFKLSVISGG